MNRILLEKSEISGGLAAIGGLRARHIAEVLKSSPGDILKTGEIDGLSGVSEILKIEREPSGDWMVTLRPRHDTPSPEPWVDLILAPPRPRELKRLLPQLAAMGAGNIVLTGAAKVEKDFWGATILNENIHRPLLIDGLMQSGVCAMPTVVTRRNLRRLMDDELESLFPLTTDRVIAHPGEAGRDAPPFRGKGRLLLAIGPEGGWTDNELRLFAAHGFRPYSLGQRILRTATAAIALLAKLNAENR